MEQIDVEHSVSCSGSRFVNETWVYHQPFDDGVDGPLFQPRDTCQSNFLTRIFTYSRGVFSVKIAAKFSLLLYARD